MDMRITPLWLIAVVGACGAEPDDDGDARGEPICTSKCDGDLHSFTLPDEVSLDGDASAFAVRDIDGDGFLDLAAIVKEDATSAALVVAFGDSSGMWTERYRRALAGDVVRSSRDSSSSVVAIYDIDRDGKLDVVSASGIARGKASRSFTWRSLGDEAGNAFQPVGVLRRGTRTYVIRGTNDGLVERCTSTGTCTALAGQPPACDPTQVSCVVEDLAIADFTGDGVLDIVAGRMTDETGIDRVRLWDLGAGWSSSTVIDDVAAVDLQVGDIDQDGIYDLVAQRREAISDFPTYTDVWFGTGEPTAPFELAQTIYNHDNHTDNAALADADGDGCLDLAMIGVDTSEIAVRLGVPSGQGCARRLGPHDPADDIDVGWTALPGYGSTIGIQQLDVNGDGVDEWSLRVSDAIESTVRLLPIDVEPPI